MGLAVRGDTLYYTDWISMNQGQMGYIKSYDLRYGVVNKVILKGRQPTGLHYSPVAHKRRDSADGTCEDASCSDTCVRVPAASEKPYHCLCPDQSSHVLSNNLATCERPQNFLMYADLNTLQLVSLDKDTEATPHVLLYDDVLSNFVALTYDPTTDTIYWSDLTRKRIYGSPFNNVVPHEVYSDNLFMDGLAVDTERQRLYFTGYNSSGWGLIGRINLQRHSNSPHTVIQGLHNPRAIHLHTEKKLMFWTEFGDKNNPPSVMRAKISGKRKKRLMSTGLFWPNTLAIHGNELYVGDGAGRVFIMDFQGTRVRELSFLKGTLFHVYGLAVFDHLLFYSDWYTHGVYMVDMVSGHQEPIARHLSRPTSLVIHHPGNLTANNECQAGGAKCDEICVPVPRSYHCSCHVGSKLAADNHTCLKMESPWEVTETARCSDVCDLNAFCAQLVPQLEYQCVCKAGYEGNGKSCGGCGRDFYKPQLGNGTCYPCPLGSSTMGSTTASQCTCLEPNTRMVNSMCIEILPETTTNMDDETSEMTSDESTGPFETVTDITTDSSDVTLGPATFPFSALPLPRRRKGDISTFELRWNVTFHNRSGLSREKVEGMTLQIKLALTKLSALPVKLRLPLHYQTIPNTVETTAPCSFSCLPGQIVDPDGCVQLPQVSGANDTGEAGENSTADLEGGGWGWAQTTESNLGGSPHYDPFPEGESVGQPYFEDCPQSREVFLQADANGRAYLDMETARDGYGRRLPVISTTDSDNNRLSLEWSKGAQQTVILNALDNWRQTATCQFQVSIVDEIPPVFSSCPGDVIKKTAMPTESVFWPTPIAEDNSLIVTISGSREPNSAFDVGITIVNYTARDESNNVAECRFTVTVILEQRCNLPSFKNGAVVCSKDSEQRELCQIQCQGGYIVNPVSIFPRPFDCREGGEDFTKLSNLMKKQSACLKKQSPTIAHQEMSLSFEGPCHPDDGQLKRKLRVHYLDALGEKNLCEWAQCSHGNVTIHCGPLPPKRHSAIPDTFDMRWNLTIQSSDGLSREKVKSIVLLMKFELMTLAASPSRVMVHQHYHPMPSSVRSLRLALTCQPGEMKYTDACVPCPIGAYHNGTTGRCRLCARGLWQNASRQLGCQQCSYGFTKEEGAISEKECVTNSPIDEMSKFLIITACTFGAVFLCMVIFMYLQYQNQQRQAKQRMALMASNPHRQLSPNVYASPPIVKPLGTDHIRRSSLDYIGCHDYEDIDGASTATKAMLQALSKSSYWHRNNSLSRSPYASNRDSLNSFKGNADILFRIPSSPTTQAANSFQTSAETLTVQSSPRGSHRSFQMTTGDGLFSKPPVSPGINHVNSFKGSPVSPYKSLNFGRDEVRPSTSKSPDSPSCSPHLPRDLESPFRLQTTKTTYDPDSPFRLARESPYGKVMVTPSPFYQELQKSIKAGASQEAAGPSGLPGSPDFSAHQTLSSIPDSPSRSAKLPRATTDTQHSFRSMPDSPIGRAPLPSGDDGGVFNALSDTLYKRPSSPVSPMPSSRLSNDSLHRSPSTPRASPLASRRRMDSSYKTPPLSRSKRSFTENSCYEYD
ncbi:hypothetical protein ACOMHN_001967 [Nucella lapillus]